MKQWVVGISAFMALFLFSCGGGTSDDPYIGIYTFIVWLEPAPTTDATKFTTAQYFIDTWVVDTRTGLTTTEGEPVYSGYHSRDKNYRLTLSYSPSRDAIVATSNDPYYLNSMYLYLFNIGDGDVLEGCFHLYQQSNGSTTPCVPLVGGSVKSLHIASEIE